MNSLFLVNCVLFVSIAASLSGIIEQLNRGIASRTIIFYIDDGALPRADVLTTAPVPTIIVTDAADFELRHLMNSEILSIVFLNGGSSASLLQTLRKTLNRLHWTNVLFIAQIPFSDGGTEWRWLFEWCWRNGFYKVLLTNITAELLLSFNPFSGFAVKNTTLRRYLQLHKGGTLDVRGYEIRTTAGSNPPRSLLYTDKKGDQIYSGIHPKLLQLFVKRINATLVMVDRLANYTLGHCLAQLAAGKIDICGDSTAMDSDLIVTRPLYMSIGYVMVRHEQPIAKFRYFLVPFGPNVWLLIAISIGYSTLLMAVVSWQQFGVWHLGKYLLAAISSTVAIPFSLQPMRGKLNIVLYAILFTAGFILSNLYLAFLSSILSSNIYDRQMDTLEDLQRENISILGDAQHARTSVTFCVPRIVMEQTLLVSTRTMDEHRRNLDPRYAYMSTKDRFELYMYQQKFMTRPRMKLIQKSVLFLWGGNPMANHWPFEERINDHMLLSYAMGFYKHFMDETMEESIRIGIIRFFKTESRDVAPLSIENFQMPAMLLAFGYTVALIAFSFEVMLSKCRLTLLPSSRGAREVIWKWYSFLQQLRKHF